MLGGRVGNAQEAQGFSAQGVEQQARRYIAVVVFFFDQRARGDHQRGVDLVHGHAVVQALEHFVEHGFGADVAQAFAGFFNNEFQPADIQRCAAAVSQCNANAGVGLFLGLGLFALFGAGGAVNHVVAGDLVFAAAHQGQFNLVLNVFNMDGAAGGHAAFEGGADLIGELGNRFVNTRRGSGGAAFNSQKGFGNGDGNFVIGVGHHCAVALDNAQLAGGGGLDFGR